MFASKPSNSDHKAADLFKKEDKKKILELGAGQARETIIVHNGTEFDATIRIAILGSIAP